MNDFKYKLYTEKKKLLIIALISICAVSFVLDVAIGSSRLPISVVVRTLLDRAGAEPLTRVIIWIHRLPAAVMALLVGLCLGLSGAVMQTILNNSLASPYTLGISAGAGLGASVALLLDMSAFAVLGVFMVPAFAFVFAMLACACIYVLSIKKNFSSETMVLAGIGMVFFFQAGQSFLQYMASPEALQSVIFWTFGSLNKATWKNIPIIAVVFVICFILIYLQSWKLTAMRLGDTKAKTLGVNIKQLRISMFIYTSMMTATAVAFVGSIGFVGIVGPHLARSFVGEDQRYFLPTSALCGAAMLSVASVISKILVPGALFPIGITTSIFGVPFFFLMILRKRK